LLPIVTAVLQVLYVKSVILLMPLMPLRFSAKPLLNPFVDSLSLDHALHVKWAITLLDIHSRYS
jgi:hypothetical protein